MKQLSKDQITQDELKNHIHYDPQTGIITRISRRNSGGSIDAYGYLIIKIKGKQYKAHRLIWLYLFGKFPEKNIDHINGNKLDNRMINIRVIDQADNCRNATIRTNSETGHRGVFIDKTRGLKKRYAFNFKGKKYRFYCPLEAYKSRVRLLKENGYGERHY